MSKKTKAQELQEQLTWSAPHIGKDAPDHKEKLSNTVKATNSSLTQEKQSASA